MFDSPRAPESEPGTCPTCDSAVNLDPGLWFGETTCSHCTERLWLIRFNHGLMSFKPSQKVKHRSLPDVLSEYLGIDEAKLDPAGKLDLGIDSLDFVELVIELEEEDVPV